MKMINMALYVLILIFSIQVAFSKINTEKYADSTKIDVPHSQKVDVETPYNDVYIFAYPPYPIPAKEKVNVMIYWDKRYDFNKAEFSIYNTEGIKNCGKERITTTQQSDWSSIVTWNASGFPFGIYIILIKHGSKTISIKVAIG